MTSGWVTGPLLLVSLPILLPAAEPSWEGKVVILSRAGVELRVPEGKDIAPKTAGVAKDLTFQVKKEENDRLLIDSRRQHGWIGKGDAIPYVPGTLRSDHGLSE